MPVISSTEAGGQNVCAFLGTITYSEIGPALIKVSDAGYNVCVGSTPLHPILFHNYADHPYIRDAKLNSDAAGAYQLMGRYWPFYKSSLKLPDFGPHSQDLVAIQLIKECKALPDILEGNIETAFTKCRSRWASFPGAGYGQHENQMQDLVNAYKSFGGTVA